MFEKNVEIGYLLDFYGELLADRRREALDMYYNDDMSLAEIADVLGITRQGVRDLIVRGGDELLHYEETLHTAAKFRAISEAAEAALQEAKNAGLESVSGQIETILKTIKD